MSSHSKSHLDELRSRSSGNGSDRTAELPGRSGRSSQSLRSNSTVPDALIPIVWKDKEKLKEEEEEEEEEEKEEEERERNGDTEDDDEDGQEAEEGVDDEDNSDLEEADKQRVVLRSTRIGGIRIRGTTVDFDLDEAVERTISSNRFADERREVLFGHRRAPTVHDVCLKAAEVERQRKAEERRKQREVVHYKVGRRSWS